MLANLQRVTFSIYCPQGHCPNGHETLTTPRERFSRRSRIRSCCVSFILDQDEPNRNTPTVILLLELGQTRRLPSTQTTNIAWSKIAIAT
jgi:hypothetical protein